MAKKRFRGKKKKGQSARPAWLGRAFEIAVLVVLWGTVAVAAICAFYAIDMPDIKQVAQPVRRPGITLLAHDGTLIGRSGDLYGKYVTLDDVPAYLPQAIIAIEDRRFYNHFGVDILGVMRAMFQNARAGHLVQGGSTLTQQLAKNLFLSPERTFKRKMQEMLLAFWLEHTYTKKQILTAYLNRVYLGAGAYGVDAAAQTYFGKSVKDINLLESAIMAGLLRAPSRFAPTHDMAEALSRAETVLNAMVEEDYISEAQKDAALHDMAVPRRKPGSGSDGRYFVDWVTDQVIALTSDTPQDMVVTTTLDMKMQRSAERHLSSVLNDAAAQNVGQAALVTLTPDGGVRALVGGRDYGESQFNRATQAMRQPGSSFKPVIYLTGIEHGLTPNDVFDDEPISIGGWSPENYDGKYRGPITVRQALAESINTVAVRILQRYGPAAAVKEGRALGVTSDLEPELSLALGTNTLTPLELTGVYATIASGGKAITPYAIEEIKNRDGQILYRHAEANPPTVADPAAVATLVDMMQDVVRYGTGKRATLDRPVAGKTGTSSDYRDAWFMGFTADYITGVWMGNDDNHMMKKVTGGSFPAALWHDYMIEVEAGLPPRDLVSSASPASEVINEIGNEVGSAAQSATDEIGSFIGKLLNSAGH